MFSYRLIDLTGVTYVDNAGSSLYLESHLDSFCNDLKSNTYGNPHSGNATSSLTHDVVEQVRFRYKFLPTIILIKRIQFKTYTYPTRTGAHNPQSHTFPQKVNLVVGGSESHLSGCFRLVTPTIW